MGIVVALFAILGVININASPILLPIFGLIAYLIMTGVLTWVSYPRKDDGEPTI